MAISTYGAATTVNYTPRIWATELQDASEAWLGLSSLVDRQYEDQLKVGNIVTIPDKNNPAVAFKSDDTTGVWANAAETMQNITVNKQAYVGFLVEDFAEVQSKYGVRSSLTEKATYSLMATVEGDLTSGLALLPSSFSQLTGALGSDPTTDNIIEAVEYLDNADVPENDRFFYMSPGTHAALLKQDVFLSKDYGQGGAVGTGRVRGSVYGATAHVSTLANNNPSTAGQSYSWFCHKLGTALIIQRAPTPHVNYVLLEIGWGVIIDVIFGSIERLILPKTLASVTASDLYNVGIRGP